MKKMPELLAPVGDYNCLVAVLLANKAYSYGIDAVIVQDLGLASYLIKNFPDLAIHASTQMSIYNLDGVKKAEKLGFSRAVLARELSIPEIENICKNPSFQKLLIYDELLLVAVDINE